MKIKVTRKQNIAKNCLVCGGKNSLGLHTDFFELDNGELLAVFKTLEEHQSYPGRTHGGISAAILDETIGRAISILEPEIWGVTIELQMKYRKPVPLGVELRAIGRITKNGRRAFEGEGELLLPNGDVAVTATGRYIKLAPDQITDIDLDKENDEWVTNFKDTDPEEVEIPEIKKR